MGRDLSSRGRVMLPRQNDTDGDRLSRTVSEADLTAALELVRWTEPYVHQAINARTAWQVCVQCCVDPSWYRAKRFSIYSLSRHRVLGLPGCAIALAQGVGPCLVQRHHEAATVNCSRTAPALCHDYCLVRRASA